MSMKNLKKRSAVMVVVAILVFFAVPAFAEEKTDADILIDLSVLKGDGAGLSSENLAKSPTRMQAAIIFLRLLGLEEEALAFTGEDSFNDRDLVSADRKAVLAYLKANPELGWLCDGTGNFNPNAEICQKGMYKVLLEALGYKHGVDFNWAEVVDFAAMKGLPALTGVSQLIDSDISKAIVEALKLEVKDGEGTLINKLVEDGVISEEKETAEGLYAPLPPQSANTLIRDFLPGGITLDTATDEQLIAAVAAAVGAHPEMAASIVTAAIQISPGLAGSITAAAIQAAPENMIADIVFAAVDAAPEQAATIMAAAIAVAQAGSVPPAQQILARTPAAFVTLPEYGEPPSPPARDDRPSSPVRP